MRKIFEKIKEFLHNLNKRENKKIKEERKEKGEKITIEINSLWNYLKIQENTQAYYLTEVLSFEEWSSMDQIRQKIKEYYGTEFKNQKSLYPYLKTMVDLGIMETTNIEGKKKWKKKEILIKTLKKEKKKGVEIEAKSQ